MLVGDIDPCNVLLKCKCLIKQSNHTKLTLYLMLGSLRYGLLGLREITLLQQHPMGLEEGEPNHLAKSP